MAVAALAFGAVVGRWLTVVVAAIVGPAFALGVWLDVWGDGFSQDDAPWTIATIVALYTLAAIMGAVIGVLARMRYRELRRPVGRECVKAI